MGTCTVKCADDYSEYNDWDNPLNCLACDEGRNGIDKCSECISHDFGFTNICLSCDDGLVPDPTGQVCQLPNCDEFWSPTSCKVCNRGFFLTFDTNECVLTCPSNLRAVPELGTCEAKCMPNQFIGDDYLCHDCSDKHPNCDTCEWDQDEIVCLTCEGVNTLSHDGRCNECKENELEQTDGTCRDCSEMLESCGKCTYSEFDYSDWQCLEC